MNRTLLKLIVFIALIILPLAMGAQSTNTDAQRALNNPYLSPQDKAIYSPVRNILEANLASTTVNDLFRQYGDALTGYVQVKNKQWENDRISCAEDVHDFLYAYMKRGDGTTPSALWSKLLQSNFFQDRTGPWNDFDGDGLINGEFINGGNGLIQVPPQGKDLDGDTKNGDKGDFDDHYGFGVPNIYNPLVKQFGRDKTVPEVMTLLGLGLDGDNDNDGLSNIIPSELQVAADGSMPYMYFASYGDANFDHTVTGQKDIYQRIGYDANGLPKINTQTNAQARSQADKGDVDKDGISDIYDINPAGNDYMFWNYQYDSPTNTANGGQYTVAESGVLLRISTDIRNIAANSRSFDAQSAYNSEEIKKILTDNCVRMADLQGIMGRLEFKELISDRIGREVANAEVKSRAQETVKAVLAGRDTDGDGEKDAPQFSIGLTEESNRSKDNELAVFNDTLPESVAKIAVNLERNQTFKNIMAPTLTAEQEAIINSSPTAQSNVSETTGFAKRFISYFTAAAGNNSSSGEGSAPPTAEDNALYWSAFKKTNEFGPDNELASFVFARTELKMREVEAEKNTREEIIAGGGFIPDKICLAQTKDGKGCLYEVNTVPASTIASYFWETINSVSFNPLNTVSEITDLVDQFTNSNTE